MQRHALFNRLRPYLIATGIIFAALLLIVGYNYAAWSAIERDCAQALNAGASDEGKAAWARGREAMDNPLLIIPSGLLDLRGPSRCRSAEREWGFGGER